MSKFLLTVGPTNVAGQISNLINAGGQLRYNMSAHTVLNNHARYMVTLDGDTVTGVVGLEQIRPDMTEIKHLCVLPEYRRRGIGKRLLERAVEVATTEYVFGLVRSDNIVNIRNNLRIGMIPIGKRRADYKNNYHIICFARRKIKDGIKRESYTRSN